MKVSFTRQIMTMAVALVVLATSCVGQEIRYRKHVEDMSDSEWKALSDAIGLLRKKPSTDPLNYEHFVRIHGGGDLPTESGCEHYSEVLWPWHRAFLLHFENALNSVRPKGSPVITLPYWDWTEVPTGKNCYPKAYEDSSNHLYDPRRNAHQPPCAPPWSHQNIEDQLSENDWQLVGGGLKDDGRTGSLESGPHNGIHGGYIGGDNRTTQRAADDPLFWAHHAYMDMLVAEWQARHPDVPHCYACNDVAYDSDPSIGPVKVKDLLSIDRLPMAGGRTIQIVYLAKGKGKALQNSVLRAAALSLTGSESEKPSQPRESSSFSFAFPDLSGSRVLLRLSGVSIPKEHPYQAEVFIYPAGVTFENAAAFSDKYKIGMFTEFANAHPQEHGMHKLAENGVTVSLDLTSEIKRKLAPLTDQGYVLTIVFKACEPGESYSKIAGEVRVSDVRLERRDFAVEENIPLTPKD
ncbi:MAG: tyrosinase family protein [Candidatus Sulfotelmatobacter sp.]